MCDCPTWGGARLSAGRCVASCRGAVRGGACGGVGHGVAYSGVVRCIRRDKGHPWVTHGSHRAPTRQHRTPCGAGTVLPWVTRFYGGCCKNPCITGLHRTHHVPETTSVTIYCHPCHLSPAPPLTCAAVRCLSRRLSRALPLALCRAAVVRAVCCAAHRPCHVSRHPSPAPLSHGASPATRRATACHAAARCSHRLAIVSCRRRSRSPRGEE